MLKTKRFLIVFFTLFAGMSTSRAEYRPTTYVTVHCTLAEVDGPPIPNGTVTLVSEYTGESASATTDADGGAYVTLGPSALDLGKIFTLTGTAEDSDHAPDAYVIFVRDDEETLEVDGAIFFLDVLADYQINGYVTTITDTPIPGATVSIFGPDDIEMYATTNPNGRYFIDHIPRAGRYQITVNAPFYESQIGHLTIPRMSNPIRGERINFRLSRTGGGFLQ